MRMTAPHSVFLCVLALVVLTAASPGSAQTPPEAPDVEIVSERLLFTRGPEGPLVLHMVQLVNVGPRRAERVPLSYPQGALLMDVPDGFEAEGGLLVDPAAMEPGEGRQYVFSYELPWQRLPMPIRRAVLYPTASLEVWAEQSLLLRGVGLRALGEEEIAGRRFTVYFTADLSPHPQWQALLETTSGPGAAVSERERLGQRSDPLDIVRANPWQGLLLVAVLALAATALYVRRRHARGGAVTTGAETGPGGGGVGPAGKTGEVARLKEEIVQLDVAFQSGDLAEDVYLERRRALREDLLRLMGSGRGGGGGADGAGGAGGPSTAERAEEGSS